MITEVHFWENVAQYSIPAALTLAGVWLTSRRTDSKVEKAIENTQPISNGFAAFVRQSLTEIKEDMRETRKEVSGVREDLADHLSDHASASLRRPQVPRQRLWEDEESQEGRAS